MRRLKSEIGTDYDGKVAFYLIGTDPRESIDHLEADRESNDYPWPVAYADESMLSDLRIYAQPSKIAMSADGTITHRYGFGHGDKYESWGDFFDHISAN